MRRATVTTSVVVPRPAERVFALLADIHRHAEWSPKKFRVENVSGPVRQGTTFTSYGWLPGHPDHRNDVEVTEFEPPSRLVLVATDRGEQFVNTFVLTPQDGGTRVDRSLDLPRPAGVVGALFPIVAARVIRPDLHKGLQKLKWLAERG